MDKTWLIMCRAASSLIEMKRSKLDELTAKTLRELIYEEDVIDPYHVKEENEADIDQEASENTNENENITGFGVNPKFIRLLESDKERVDLLTLPPLGQAIDGIALPKFPPIETLQGQIGTCSIPFEKQLTKTDLDMGQGRLSICKMAVKELMEPMIETRESLKLGIDVTVYDEKGRAFPMSFRLWSNKIYVLTVGWKRFAMENELRMLEDWVTVWMFRRNDTNELCFAIVPRRLPITGVIGKAKKKGSKGVVKKEKGKE